MRDVNPHVKEVENWCNKNGGNPEYIQSELHCNFNGKSLHYEGDNGGEMYVGEDIIASGDIVELGDGIITFKNNIDGKHTVIL